MRLAIKRKPSPSRLDEIGRVIISIALAFIIFSFVFWQAGVNPLVGYKTVFTSAFLFKPNLLETIARTSTILLLALAFIIPHKAGLWNIGAQGQLYIGMIAATGISYQFSYLPSYLLLPLMGLGAMFFGGVWGGIPGILKAKYSVTEIVTTLFFNTIAILTINFLVVRGPWMSEAGRPESRPIPVNGILPTINGTTIPYSIIFVIGVIVVITFLLKKTVFGYEVKTFGINPSAAKYAGMNEVKIIMLTMLLGGLLAGFAGFNHISGATGVLRSTIAASWGYFALVFALFAGSDPLISIFSVFFFSGFLVGTQILESEFGMGHGVQYLFMGILIVSWLFSHINQYRIVRYKER